MQVAVYRKNCIQCGVCAALCSEVFSLQPGLPAQASIDAIPEKLQPAVQKAADICPTGAIRVHA